MNQSALPNETGSLEPLEVAILSYLKAHPDFFSRHADLCQALQVPAQSGNLISIAQYHIERLKQDNLALKQQLAEAIKIARENEVLFAAIKSLTLSLLPSNTLAAMTHLLSQQVRTLFNVEHVYLHLLKASAENTPFVRAMNLKQTRKMIGERIYMQKPFCGDLSMPQREYLFGENSAHILSTVVIPLYDGECIGLLALGSEQDNQFPPQMDTLFLGYLGEMISQLLILIKA